MLKNLLAGFKYDARIHPSTPSFIRQPHTQLSWVRSNIWKVSPFRNNISPSLAVLRLVAIAKYVRPSSSFICSSNNIWKHWKHEENSEKFVKIRTLSQLSLSPPMRRLWFSRYFEFIIEGRRFDSCPRKIILGRTMAVYSVAAAAIASFCAFWGEKNLVVEHGNALKTVVFQFSPQTRWAITIVQPVEGPRVGRCIFTRWLLLSTNVKINIFAGFYEKERVEVKLLLLLFFFGWKNLFLFIREARRKGSWLIRKVGERKKIYEILCLLIPLKRVQTSLGKKRDRHSEDFQSQNRK